MTPFQFLRTVLWLLLLMEAVTALAVGLWPVAPINRSLADGIVCNCLGAAGIAIGSLALLRWVQRHG